MRGIINIAVSVIAWSLAIFFTFGLALFALAAWAYLVFNGAEARAKDCEKRFLRTLMPSETVKFSAIQLRPFALFQRRKFLAITSSRIVVITRGLVGGFKMHDVQWKDLLDARIDENAFPALCGANLVFAHSNRAVPQIDVPGIPSHAASEMYSTAQFEEQAWEEKRRIRALEEKRAAAGGVMINQGAPAASAPSAGGNRMVEEIQQAKQLLDSGAVSDAEFQEMKSKILGRA